MKILMVHDNYKWDSYSIVRSACDILKEREDVEYIELGSEKINELGEGDYVWIYSSRFSLLNIEYEELKKKGVTIVNLGLSDPNMFEEERLKWCDVYCTNDWNTFFDYGANPEMLYLFLVGVDLKRFQKIDTLKVTDVLFVGTFSHPYIPMRKTYIQKLKDENFNFKGFGEGFKRYLNGPELITEYNLAHLNLDICTKYSSLGSRIFQAAACGVPTLTLKREDVLQCFEDGKEILTYEGGYNEMKYAIIEALRDKDKLAWIGENARQRCIKEHGMRKRIDDLIKYLGELNGSEN